ncbi:hypothetical protein O181_078724 [Austropuccinia psidii MF-1]|uniref:RxLR effector protein n=1 Tax=Austropuccinia psidii MF-1 TaxID=1389203 RepID=A0A9Q3FH24_9BASI|nr:hypothetical protein [Austropuccinia psidii MF-1]
MSLTSISLFLLLILTPQGNFSSFAKAGVVLKKPSDAHDTQSNVARKLTTSQIKGLEKRDMRRTLTRVVSMHPRVAGQVRQGEEVENEVCETARNTNRANEAESSASRQKKPEPRPFPENRVDAAIESLNNALEKIDFGGIDEMVDVYDRTDEAKQLGHMGKYTYDPRRKFG